MTGLRTIGAVMALCVAMAGHAAEADVVERLQEYLRVDTTNPPGNEQRAVAFFAAIFDAHGIAWESAESAPGRGNIWARLPGGDAPGLVLLNHTDVVPADARRWDVPPLSGAVRDGYVHGRGALDMKSTAVVQLQAFLALAADPRPRNRDVLFVATADEETGGAMGAGFLLARHPELFEGVGFLLNEGGRGVQYASGPTVVSVEVTQKVPMWLRLTAEGHPGHGAAPRVESAVTRLLRALVRIDDHEFEPRLLPAVERYMRGVADLQSAHLRDGFADPGTAIGDAEFLKALQLHLPGAHAALRNTCSITRLGGSVKINVVPSTAFAELDCRLLPDEDPDAFLKTLDVIINDRSIGVSRLLSFSPAMSAIDTPLFAAIEATMAAELDGVRVLPSMGIGFTDSHFFRDLGIVSYGFAPFVVRQGEYPPGEGAHGHNERISVANVRRGERLMLDLLRRFVYD